MTICQTHQPSVGFALEAALPQLHRLSQNMPDQHQYPQQDSVTKTYVQNSRPCQFLLFCHHDTE